MIFYYANNVGNDIFFNVPLPLRDLSSLTSGSELPSLQKSPYRHESASHTAHHSSNLRAKITTSPTSLRAASDLFHDRRDAYFINPHLPPGEGAEAPGVVYCLDRGFVSCAPGRNEPRQCWAGQLVLPAGPEHPSGRPQALSVRPHHWKVALLMTRPLCALGVWQG